MKSKIILVFLFVFSSVGVFSQNREPVKATTVGKAAYVREIPALAKMRNIISAKGFGHKPGAKKQGKNSFVPGKGFPKGNDPLMQRQKSVKNLKEITPLKSFDTHKGDILNDPTGAIGPNHYVYAFNSGFGILDRDGNVLLEEASLATLFPGEEEGDPIVIYDNFADRFVIMEFTGSEEDATNGVLLAVSKGADPVNEGWTTYRFNTSDFPDYPKLSIWSDGYYMTANMNQEEETTKEVIYVFDRDKMLTGDADAGVVTFSLAGVSTNGFYSPGGFNATGKTLPPIGTPCSIVYMQDDSWEGVEGSDHLKIWDIKVDWTNPESSTISQPKSLEVTPFDSVFHDGSFNNLAQLGGSDEFEIDALQGAMMYMTNYRRFSTHNSVVFNFVVDLFGNDTTAGIRWYELRQADDNAPWVIHQEGTYVQPDGYNAFCGSMAIDSQGNIGLGYTIVSDQIHLSLRYTGRMQNDPLGTMTIKEGVSANGNINSNTDDDGRYGDYAQMTIDPLDGDTFWYIGEYMKDATLRRKSHVVAFKLKPDVEDVEAPTAPLDLVALATTESKTILQWGKSTDNVSVNSYDIIQDGEVVSKVTDTLVEVTGLAKETTYEFKVAANDAGGNSTESNAIEVTTVAVYEDNIAPFAPNNFRAFNVGETSLDLSWDASLDDVDVENYIVFKDGKELDTIAALKYKVLDLEVETTYDFSVKALDSKGVVSESSAVVNITTDELFVDTIPPTPPAILFVENVSGSGCKLFILDSEDNVGVVLYKIFQNDVEIGTIELQPGETVEFLLEFDVTGLEVEKEYVFTASAQDAAGLESDKGLALSMIVNEAVIGSSAEDDFIQCVQSKPIEIEINHDVAPNEIYWELVDAEGNKIADKGYDFFDITFSTDKVIVDPLPPGDYVFSISDSSGDGMCCQNGPGFFSVSTEDGIIAVGAEFGAFKSYKFCVVPEGEVVTDDDLNELEDAEEEGEEEGEEDEDEEVDNDSEAKCVDAELLIKITFDDKAEETSWDIKDSEGALITSKSYSNGESGKSFTEAVKIPTNGEYTFTIMDSGNDGICCETGSGFYSVVSKTGDIVSGGEFTASESTTFCIEDSKLETVELTDNGSDNRFKLSPNPTNDVLSIAIDKTPIKRVEIYSMLGRLVRTSFNQGFKENIDVSKLQSGAYFARIYAGSDIITRKFVKE